MGTPGIKILSGQPQPGPSAKNKTFLVRVKLLSKSKVGIYIEWRQKIDLKVKLVRNDLPVVANYDIDISTFKLFCL